MPAPVVPFLIILGRSLGMALRRWQGIVAITGLIFATGFTFNSMVRQMGETALNLWPLLAAACFFLFVKEIVRAWIKIRKFENKPRGGK